MARETIERALCILLHSRNSRGRLRPAIRADVAMLRAARVNG